MVLMGEAADALPWLVLQPGAQTLALERRTPQGERHAAHGPFAQHVVQARFNQRAQRRALAGSGLFGFCQQQVTHIGG